MRHVALVFAAVLACASPALAQDKTVEWRFSHWVPPSHPMHPSAEAWAESIEQASGGTIKMKIFPSQQLGKAFDHYNMVRDGIADVGIRQSGLRAGPFPGDGRDGTAVPVRERQGWQRRARTPGTANTPPRRCRTSTIASRSLHDPGKRAHRARRKSSCPADIKGMKMRPANATIARFITLLGGNNIQASAPESRDVLEKGVAEGITFPWGSIVLFGIDKVTKFHIDSSFYVTEQGG